MPHRFPHAHLPPSQNLKATKNAIGRFYEVNGQFYPSVTTVTGFEKQAFFASWRKKPGNAEYLAYTQRRGNAIHSALEAYVNNRHTYKDYLTDERYVKLFNQIAPVLEQNLETVFAQEQALYSDHLRMAGRVDLVSRYDGLTSIVDFKGSTKTKSKSQIKGYFMQAAAYALMVEERFGISVPQIVILIAVEERKHPLIFIEQTENYIAPLIKTVNKFFIEYLPEQLAKHQERHAIS